MAPASETASSGAPFFFDTHCHLDAAEFDADRDAVYAAAIVGGVEFRRVEMAVGINKKRHRPGCRFGKIVHAQSSLLAKPSSCSRLVKRLKIVTYRVTVAMM